MSLLADMIEQYIQSLLRDGERDVILLQRNELASELGCAPSQVSYVLQTRFTLARGYLVESRKGSGGYIRVRRVQVVKDYDELVAVPKDRYLSVAEVDRVLTALQIQNILTRREEMLLRTVWQELDRRYDPDASTEIVQAVLLRLLSH